MALTQQAVIGLILQHIGGSKIAGAGPRLVANGRQVIVKSQALTGLVTRLRQIATDAGSIRGSLLANPLSGAISSATSRLSSAVGNLNLQSLSLPNINISSIASDVGVGITSTTQLGSLNTTQLTAILSHNDITPQLAQVVGMTRELQQINPSLTSVESLFAASSGDLNTIINHSGVSTELSEAAHQALAAQTIAASDITDASDVTQLSDLTSDQIDEILADPQFDSSVTKYVNRQKISNAADAVSSSVSDFELHTDILSGKNIPNVFAPLEFSYDTAVAASASAQTYSTQAANYAANAQSAAANAAISEGLSANAAFNANSSAAAAFTYMTAANTFANDSYQSAQASQSSALAANVHANDAFTYSTSAAASAVSANSDAASASSSSTLAANYAANAAANAASAAANATAAAASATSASANAASANSSAVLAANLIGSVLPSEFSQGGKFWMNTFAGIPGSSPLTTATYPTVTNIGIVAQQVLGSGTTSFDIAHSGWLPLVPNRRYRLSTKMRILTTINGTSPHIDLFIIGLNADGTYTSAGISASSSTLSGNTWSEVTVNCTSAELTALTAGTSYVRGLARITLATSTGSNTIQWAYIKLEDLDNVQYAQVATLAQASVDSGTGLAIAGWETTTTAGSATAAIRMRTQTGANTFSSSVALEAEEIQFYNVSANTRTLAGKVVGGKSTWTGDMDVGGCIRVGSRRIPVALQAFQLLAEDGESVSFGTDLTNTPKLIFDSTGLVPKAATESYVVSANNLTSTGFDMVAKVATPGTTNTVSSTSSSHPGGTPGWQIQKADAADAYNGYYTFSTTVDVDHTDMIDLTPTGIFWGGTASVDCYVRPAGAGSWTYVDTISDYYTDGPGSYPGVLSHTLSGTVYHTGAIGQDGANTEFGVADNQGTITAFGSVTYTKQGTSGTSSATPSGQKVIVTVIPQNS